MYLISPVLNNDILHIWLYNDVPHNIKQLLDLPDKDKGIDILIQKTYNEYCAIQYKFRQKWDTFISWKE